MSDDDEAPVNHDEDGEEEDEDEDEDEDDDEELDMAALTRLYQDGDTFGIMAWRNEDGSLRSAAQKHDQVRHL